MGNFKEERRVVATQTSHVGHVILTRLNHVPWQLLLSHPVPLPSPEGCGPQDSHFVYHENAPIPMDKLHLVHLAVSGKCPAPMW